MSSDIIVVAGGWSVGQYDTKLLHERGFIISVNDAALHIQGDAVVTMDRLWIEARYNQLLERYPPWRMHVREGVAKSVELSSAVHQFKHDGKNPSKMSLRADHLNGSNSGTCAVNLALQFALARDLHAVYLLGFDMQDGPKGEKHFYPPYPWRPNGATKTGNFRDWAAEFEQIKEQFDDHEVSLINVNHRSAIKSLPCVSYKQLMSGL